MLENLTKQTIKAKAIKATKRDEDPLTSVATFPEKRRYNLPGGVICFNQQNPHRHFWQELLPTDHHLT